MYHLLLLAALVLAAAQPQGDFFVYDPADESVPATLLGSANDYEASVASTAQGLWVTWLEFVPGKGDFLWVGCRRGERWLTRSRVNAEPACFASPTLTADAAGRLWLSYEVETDGQWDVVVVPQQADGSFTESGRWSSASPGPDIHHRAAAAPDRGIYLIWQAARNGRFEIHLAHITGQSDPTVVVASDPELSRTAGPDAPDAGSLAAPLRNHWHPDVGVGPDGTLFITWDAYDGSSYNVYARGRRGDTWTAVTPLTGTPNFEGRARLAVTRDSRAWVVWEEGEENWGEEFRAGLDENGRVSWKMTDRRGSLHRFRGLEIAQLQWREPMLAMRRLNKPLPMPAMEAALARPDAPDGVKALGAFYERAELALDAGGRLWVFWRHYYTPWLGFENYHHVESGWGVYARCLTSRGWSRLYRLAANQGDGMQRLAVAAHGDGIAAVCTIGRTDRKHVPTTPESNAAPGPGAKRASAPAARPGAKRPRGVACALLSDMSPPPGELPLSEIVPAAPMTVAPQPARIELPPAAGEYKLFFGDLHRHTDLSLCGVATDGTMDDAYRYAIDVARLNFFGVTDHTHDLAWGDPLCQLWWRTTKEVTRHELAPDFWPIHSYERSRSDTDHNVFSLRRDVLRPHTYPLPEFWKELDHDTFTVPHQPVKPSTWQQQDDLHRPLLEIYQGCRDLSIESDAHEALGRGYLMGFIASSDHISTSASYAGVFAPERTRTSIFRALQARRTFGATARIWLLVRAGEHWMGERFRADAFPTVTIEAGGTTEVERIEVLIDGQVAVTLPASGHRVSLTCSPPAVDPGLHYLYVRLLQSDGNRAWSSPIWIHAR